MHLVFALFLTLFASSAVAQTPIPGFMGDSFQWQQPAASQAAAESFTHEILIDTTVVPVKASCGSVASPGTVPTYTCTTIVPAGTLEGTHTAQHRYTVTIGTRTVVAPYGPVVSFTWQDSLRASSGLTIVPPKP